MYTDVTTADYFPPLPKKKKATRHRRRGSIPRWNGGITEGISNPSRRSFGYATFADRFKMRSQLHFSERISSFVDRCQLDRRLILERVKFLARVPGRAIGFRRFSFGSSVRRATKHEKCICSLENLLAKYRLVITLKVMSDNEFVRSSALSSTRATIREAYLEAVIFLVLLGIISLRENALSSCSESGDGWL